MKEEANSCSLTGPAVTGTPIVGIFNTTINPQSALIPLATFPGVLPGLPYVVRSHVTGTLTAPLILPDPSDLTTSSTSYTLTPPYVTASQSSDARPTVIRTAAWGGSLGTAYSTPGGRQFSTAAPSASSAATATKGVLPVPSSTLFQVTLPVRGFDILTAHPVMTLRVSATNDGHTQNMTVVTAWQAPLAWRCVTTHEDGANTSTVTSFRDVLIAHLGLLDKMTGAAALLPGTMIGIRDDGDDDDSEKKKPTGMRMNVVATARLKALGIVGLYVSALPEINLEEDSMVTIRGQPVPFDTVQVRDGNEGKVLGVDVAKAWDEMGFGSGGWSNEVEVKIYFRVKALEYH